MDAAVRQRYETQSKVLRVKIKAWEVEFYQSHDGKKPSRDDIKTSGMSMSMLTLFSLHNPGLTISSPPCRRHLQRIPETP